MIKCCKWLVIGLATFAGWSLTAGSVSGADTVKIGVLHSLSGTMAISETLLRDVVLMAVEETIREGECWAAD